MKTKVLTTVLAILGSVACMAQTPEEERAQKMMDSIMQSMPENQRAMMQGILNQSKEIDDKRKAEKEKAKKAQMAKNKAAQQKNEEDFYWRNKIATNTSGKFENWQYGSADIKVSFSNGRGMPPTILKLGEVSADGQVTVLLPKLDFRNWKMESITERKGDQFGYAFNDRSLELSYSNENVKYLSTDHRTGIYRGEEYLGALSLGNSIKPVANDAPCCFDKAGDGYRAHWVFMSQASTIKGANGNIVHNLNFQSGWNLIMVRFEGSQEKSATGAMAGGPFWKNQYFSATTSLPSDAKYYFHLNQ